MTVDPAGGPERANEAGEMDFLSADELRFLSLATLIGAKRSMALLRHAFGASALRSAMPVGRSPRLKVDDDRIWIFVEIAKKVKNFDVRSACEYIARCGGFPTHRDSPSGQTITFLKKSETLRRRYGDVSKDKKRCSFLEYYVDNHIQYWKISGRPFDIWYKRQLRARPRSPIVPGGGESQSDDFLLVINTHHSLKPTFE
jgi:hypothetical protein